MKNNVDVKIKLQNLLLAVAQAKNIVDETEKELQSIENQKKQFENDLKQIADKKIKELTEIREAKESFEKYKQKEIGSISQDRMKLDQLKVKVDQDLVSAKKDKDEAESLLKRANVQNEELQRLKKEYEEKMSAFKLFVSKQQS